MKIEKEKEKTYFYRPREKFFYLPTLHLRSLLEKSFFSILSSAAAARFVEKYFGLDLILFKSFGSVRWVAPTRFISNLMKIEKERKKTASTGRGQKKIYQPTHSSPLKSIGKKDPFPFLPTAAAALAAPAAPPTPVVAAAAPPTPAAATAAPPTPVAAAAPAAPAVPTRSKSNLMKIEKEKNLLLEAEGRNIWSISLPTLDVYWKRVSPSFRTRPHSLCGERYFGLDWLLFQKASVLSDERLLYENSPRHFILKITSSEA